MSALMPSSFDSENLRAISAAMLFDPWLRMDSFGSKTGEMISVTAIVSPSARPRPSIEPPMMPPWPKGSTTSRTTPHRVPPRASAPSRSPAGAWENTSRMIDVEIGMTISDTMTPATNVDDGNTASDVPPSSGTEKKGIHPRWSASHLLKVMRRGCR